MRAAASADKAVFGVVRAGFDLVTDRAFGRWRDVAVLTQVGAVGGRPARDHARFPAFAADPPGLAKPPVTGLAERSVGVADLGGADGAAGNARVRRRRPAVQAERPAVRAAGDGHPHASAASAFLDDLGINAVAGGADAALVPACQDAGNAPASAAGLLVAAGAAGLADAPGGTEAGQLNVSAAALRAAGGDDVGASSSAQGVCEPHHHDRGSGVLPRSAHRGGRPSTRPACAARCPGPPGPSRPPWRPRRG